MRSLFHCTIQRISLQWIYLQVCIRFELDLKIVTRLRSSRILVCMSSKWCQLDSQIAAATFLGLMDVLFRRQIGKDTNAFLGDLLTHSKEEIEIIPKFGRNLYLFQTRLGCTCKKRKILPVRLSYLGHEITSKGILPSSDKIEKVVNWPFQTSGTEILSFVSFCNYYRNLIPKCVDTASCFNEAAKEKLIPHSEERVTAWNDWRLN